MGEFTDKLKGKAKQVTGILTNDEGMKREGQLDEAKGNLKGVINKVDQAAQKAVDTVKNTVKRI